MWDAQGRSGQIGCGRQFMNSLADSSFEEVRLAILEEPWLAEHFDIGERYIRTKSKRVYYSFTGLDRNIDSVKSQARILLFWIDEADPVTEEAFTKLIPTLREEDSELWVTWNPERKGSATDKRFKNTKDPLYKIAEVNWRDNPRFPQKLERERQRDKADRPDEYEHIWEGEYKTIVQGAIYAAQLRKVREEKRLLNIPIDPIAEVHTFWDLGRNDHTAIWFMQRIGADSRFIDYYESRLVGLDHYVSMLRELGYNYGKHYLPHDVEVKELSSNRSRREMLEESGLKPIDVVPRIHSINEGIEQTRRAFSGCYFHQSDDERGQRMDRGMEALSNYQYVYDEKNNTFRQAPLHNWASNGADAFRQFGQGFKHAILETPFVSERRQKALRKNNTKRSWIV